MHVAHVVVDGVIDIPRTREWVLQGEDAKLSADAVSEMFRVLLVGGCGAGGQVGWLVD